MEIKKGKKRRGGGGGEYIKNNARLWC